MKTKKDQSKAFWFSFVIHLAIISVIIFSMRGAPPTYKKTIDLDLAIKKFKEAPPPPPEETPEPEKEEIVKKGPTPKDQTGMAKRAPGPAAPQGPQTQANSSVAVDAPANSGRAPFMGGDGYGDGSGGDGEEGDSILTEYMKEHFSYIRDIIFQHIRYPEEAKQKGLEGKVLVAFVIMEDGTVKDIKIIASSGFELLDKSAVETIKVSAPFPKPPAHAELRLPITYVIETETG
jgi:periplasmic protein TonB